jgi:hypothetical protein
VLSLLGNDSVTATAAPGAAGAILATFPALNATDAVTPEPPITCTGPLGPGGSPVQVAAGPAGTVFPVGVTTVSCIAADAAGNVSPVQAFAVIVACGGGYSFKDATCSGACAVSTVPR